MVRLDSRRRPGPPARPGAILLVVLTLLALFAVIGLAFVLYAESESTAARVHREAIANAPSVPDPSAPAQMVLSQVLSSDTDEQSALTGHSLARLMYGGDDGTGKARNLAYNGVGLIHEMLTLPATMGTIDRAQVVNFSAWENPLYVTANAVKIDPEHAGGPVRSGASWRTAAKPPTYVPKNAPYTYPDRNNVLVAMMRPDTGEIVAISGHRAKLFDPAGSSGPSGLDQTNPNWTSPTGRFMTLRPRPGDHKTSSTDTPQFPYPPANPDGTITGDMQNIRFTQGVQHNDSIWIDANLPIVTFRGRRVRPLVAMCLLPLDGRLNLNAVGNLLNGGMQHLSHSGFGPHEINPAVATNAVVPSKFAELLNRRYGGAAGATNTAVPAPPGATGTTVDNKFQPYPDPAFAATVNEFPPPASSTVNFYPSNTSPTFALPAAGSLATVPTYTNYTATVPGTSQHPLMWNPYRVGAFTANGQDSAVRTFPVSDVRRLGDRYSDKASNLVNSYLGSDQPAAGNFNADFGTSSAANSKTRALTTEVSNSLKYPRLAPNFFGGGATPPTLQLVAGQLQLAAAPTLTLSPAPTAGADNTAANSLANIRAAIGSVDLNRPLKDYRKPGSDTPGTPLSATSVDPTSESAARIDRQAFARDIFVRLCVATGTAVNPTVPQLPILPDPADSTNGSTTQSYQALRYLAQLAANIVDAVDPDDVSTVFVWNPKDPMTTKSYLNYDPSDPTFASTAQTSGVDFTMAADVNNRVVFGVERPRLVINEAYAEAANDPADIGIKPPAMVPKATTNYELRFFVELLNPTGTGEVSTLQSQTVPLTVMGQPVYKLDVYDDSADAGFMMMRSEVNPANPTGTPAGTARLSIDVTGGGLPAYASGVNGNTDTAATNFTADGTTPDAHGFLFLTPTVTARPMPVDPAFIPPDGTKASEERFKLTVRVPAGAAPNDLKYNEKVVPGADMTALNRKHAVILRRLANPYLPAAPANPSNLFITVDMTTNLKTQNAIGYTDAGAGSPTAIGTREAFGRFQPYAGRSDGGGLAATDTVNAQTNTNGGSMSLPKSSFLQHNAAGNSLPAAADANLCLPFEWIPHFDRRLINQSELLHVAACAPYELTRRFALGNAAMGPPAATTRPNFHGQTAQGPLTANSPTAAPLYRALELLAVKPWGFDLPEGGRVPGKINVNMIWDEAVLQALLDGNDAGGKGNGFDTAAVTTIWNSLKTSRTPGFPNPGNTAEESGTATDDRPFKSFGAAQFAAGTTVTTATGIDDTLLRSVSGAPLFSHPAAAPAGPHPYTTNEPLRKILNNVTTTTDTYLLVYTIGYFEVRQGDPSTPANPVVLGKEAFNAVPGDLRAQYAAVLDRSLLMTGSVDSQTTPWVGELAAKLENVTTAAATPNPTPIPMTINGSLSGATVTGIYEGKTWTIQDGTVLTVSSGGAEVVVMATGSAGWMQDAATGRVKIQVKVQGVADGYPIGPGTAEFPAGSLVTNFRTGPTPDVRLGYTPTAVGQVAPFDAKTPPPAVLFFGRLTPNP